MWRIFFWIACFIFGSSVVEKNKDKAVYSLLMAIFFVLVAILWVLQGMGQ